MHAELYLTVPITVRSLYVHSLVGWLKTRAPKRSRIGFTTSFIGLEVGGTAVFQTRTRQEIYKARMQFSEHFVIHVEFREGSCEVWRLQRGPLASAATWVG